MSALSGIYRSSPNSPAVGAAGYDQSSALAPYFGSVVPMWIRSLLFSIQTYSSSSQPGRK